MHIEDFLKKIEGEVKANKENLYNEEVKIRLQEVVSKYEGDDRMVSSLELAEEIRKELPVIGYKTGIETIDELIGSFRDGQLITISGITKHGKTEFAYFLTKCFNVFLSE